VFSVKLVSWVKEQGNQSIDRPVDLFNCTCNVMYKHSFLALLSQGVYIYLLLLSITFALEVRDILLNFEIYINCRGIAGN
jgi:hypothetical protein